MTTVIDTPEGMQYVRILTVAHALTLEINTGMKMSRGISALKVAKRDGLTTHSRKPAALRDVVAVLQEINPDYVPDKRMEEAMLK